MKLILLLCATACLIFAEAFQCPAGQGFDSNWACRPCEEGKFRDASHYSNWCRLCPFGYSNGVKGATDESSCTKCDKGYARDADSGECVKCSKGTYSDTLDATSCTSCPEGTTTMVWGSQSASSCTDVSCYPGYGYEWSLGGCRICYKRYSPDGQTPGCLLCPTGSWANTDGATSIEQCTDCWGGYEKVGKRCVACPVGTFRSFDDDPETKCQTCPEGTTTTRTGRHKCECLPGHAKKDFSDHRCYPCPIGRYTDPSKFYKFCFQCPIGTTTEQEGTSSRDECIAV